jgi:hypothetical protein
MRGYRDMANTVAHVATDIPFWRTGLLMLLTSSILIAGEGKQTEPASAKEEIYKFSGTVLEISTSASTIKIRQRTQGMPTNAVDQAQILTHLVLYDNSTVFLSLKTTTLGAAIGDLKTNDYVLVSYKMKDMKRLATEIIWGMPRPRQQ